MDFEDEEFIKREQSDDLLFEAYEEPIKAKGHLNIWNYDGKNE